MFNLINQNLFSLIGKVDAICITTNGYVNKQGLAVMGRGCVKEVSERLRELPRILAEKIKENGNVVNLLLQEGKTWIISFPVKPISVKNNDNNIILPHLRKIYANKEYIPGFAVYADIQIIENSAKQLRELVDKMGFKTVALPLPGCGAGGLKAHKVVPILKKYFDERFIICEKDFLRYEFLKLVCYAKPSEPSKEDIEWARQELKAIKNKKESPSIQRLKMRICKCFVKGDNI